MGITHKQRGFTIIEVSLFVAVAGLLLMGVMTGITSAINQQRFRDTVNNAQNILQQQFDQVQSVSNNSSTDNNCGGEVVGGSTNCSIVGKLIDLGPSGGAGDGSVIATYDILTKSDISSEEGSLIDILNGSDVKIVDNSNKQTFPIDWGGVLKNKTSGAAYSRYLAIIQNPVIGGDIGVYKVDISNISFSADNVMSLNGKIMGKDTYTPTPICIESQDIISLKGTLNITQGGSPDAVTVDFKGEDC